MAKILSLPIKGLRSRFLLDQFERTNCLKGDYRQIWRDSWPIRGRASLLSTEYLYEIKAEAHEIITAWEVIRHRLSSLGWGKYYNFGLTESIGRTLSKKTKIEYLRRKHNFSKVVMVSDISSAPLLIKKMDRETDPESTARLDPYGLCY